MGLVKDIVTIRSLFEQEDLFKPSTADQAALRMFPDDPEARSKYMDLVYQKAHKEEFDRLRRQQEREQREAFYNSLPYTYEDITRLPAYDKIMHIEGVRDVTTPLLKRHRTATFHVIAGKESQSYKAYANGYLRSSIDTAPGILKRMPPALTLNSYNVLLNRLSDTIMRFVNLNTRPITSYKYKVTDNRWKFIEYVYFSKRFSDEHVRDVLINRDGYDNNIHVHFSGVERGKHVREKIN